MGARGKLAQILTVDRCSQLGPDATSWVVTSYYLAFGGLLLLGGRAGDLLGRRRVLLAGTALFTAASLFGGLASDGAVLILTRALQGLGAAAAAPNVLALLITTFTDTRARARAIAVYAAMSSVGAATGLIAGGLLVQFLGIDPVRAEPEAATELIELCGSLPLALRIAVANLANRRGVPLLVR